MPDLGPLVVTAFEAEIAVAGLAAVGIALATLLHWGWLRLVDVLPDPERHGKEASK